MVVLLLTKKIVKKPVKKFKRPQSDHKIFVKTNWCRPKGIDSRVRRKFKGCTLMPIVGYGSDKRIRHYLPKGFKKFVVEAGCLQVEFAVEFQRSREVSRVLWALKLAMYEFQDIWSRQM
ncbi:60S ribosomal protein L32-1-like [Juglans microcarpa x Juglans regia]|uniref:60S ribosomal protein L32-1-like n=1 Tax=Juglans microcarpa x Juglans regia TaxID=2249226 RepID=UPI001B7E4623|nr:60S ribosomal protein L32-1-like [Juglans microcarpa x Juglans regia]